MDVREKLVELLEKASHECGDFYDLWDMQQAADDIADFLIAHGVTVQEWISVKDRLPERKCDCLTARKGDVYVESWNGVLFSERNHHGQPTHWMPLPQPPKGE